MPRLHERSQHGLTIICGWWCGLIGVVEDGGICRVQAHAEAFLHAQDTNAILQVKCITETQAQVTM